MKNLIPFFVFGWLMTIPPSWIWLSGVSPMPLREVLRTAAIALTAVCLFMLYTRYKPHEETKVYPQIVWTIPHQIAAGTPLSENELDARAEVDGKPIAGKYVYNPTKSSILDSGTKTLSVEFLPDQPDKYFPLGGTVALVVKAAPTKATTVLSPPTDPVIHIDPESGVMERDKGTKGVFTLSLSNTGFEDLVAVSIYNDYFVAKKYPEIRVTRIGGNSLNPDTYFATLSRHTKARFKLNFSDQIDSMWKFAALGNHPNCLGVRVRVTYRRKSDGKDFSFVTIYGVTYQALGIYMMDRSAVGLPPSFKNGSLSLPEIQPYLLSNDRWTDAVYDVNKGELIDSN